MIAPVQHLGKNLRLKAAIEAATDIGVWCVTSY